MNLSSSVTVPNSPNSMLTRIINFPLTQIVVAIVMIVASVFATGSLIKILVPNKDMRAGWPYLVLAAVCVAAYFLYVRLMEKRVVSEFSRARALPELGLGILCGLLLIAIVMGALAILGVYQVSGMNSWTGIIIPIGEMTMVAFMEEVLFRGVIFRLIEKSLGTWIALAISALLFGVMHAANDGANALAILSVTVAGLLLTSVYIKTRRLWISIGIHFAWNYTLTQIFSVPSSGHQFQGLLIGKTVGAEWLTGGAFGVEASVVTVFVISAASIYLLATARQQGCFIPPFWKKSVK